MWCAATGTADGVPTAQSVNCTTKDPSTNPQQIASLNAPVVAPKAALVSDTVMAALESTVSTQSTTHSQSSFSYHMFTSLDEQGHNLLKQYKNPPSGAILASCEVCHR